MNEILFARFSDFIPISASCFTTSGPGSECSFPFIFSGFSYTGCTIAEEPEDNPKPWCITETDASGFPLLDENGGVSHWGYCPSSCPIDQGVIEKCETVQSVSL